jgi:hypothetical protein
MDKPYEILELPRGTSEYSKMFTKIENYTKAEEAYILESMPKLIRESITTIHPYSNKRGRFCIKSQVIKTSKYKNTLSKILNEEVCIDTFEIFKSEDDWFIIRAAIANKITYYKCDQVYGVCECLIRELANYE